MAIADIDILLANSDQKKYDARSTIIYAGDHSESLFYLIKGTASLTIENEEGKEIIIDYRHSGSFLGETHLYDENPVQSVWAHAKTDCIVAEISYRQFHELAASDPLLLRLIGQQMAESVKRATQKIGDLAFYDVTGRIVNALLSLCNDPNAMTHPDGMQIKISRQEISRIVGCSREKVGLVLKSLEAQGLMSVQGKTIVIFGQR